MYQEWEIQRNAYILFGQAEGKGPLGGPNHRCECIIKMDLREKGVWVCGVDTSGLGSSQVVGCCNKFSGSTER
jgi:hypothetical protein